MIRSMLLARLGAAVLTIALFAAPAAAQATNVDVREVLPGSDALDGARVQPGTWRVRYVLVKDGTEREVGGGTAELTPIAVEGEAGVRSVSTFRTEHGTGVDTAIVLRASLAPVAHRSGHPKRSLALDFHGKTVSARMTPEGETEQAVTHELGTPAFDANTFEIVMGALDLKEGLDVRLPMYIYEKNGIVWFEVKVIGSENIEFGGNHTPAWKLHVSFGTGSGTFWVARAARQFMRAEFVNPDSSQTHIIRVADAHH